MDPNQYPRNRIVLFFFLCFIIAYIHIVFLITQNSRYIAPGVGDHILIASSTMVDEYVTDESLKISEKHQIPL